uniref:Putative ovule protein n=1 Tax=Solanum chacoense TaxID=4108 RepID=A0A0V0GRH3_SOLCH
MNILLCFPTSCHVFFIDVFYFSITTLILLSLERTFFTKQPPYLHKVRHYSTLSRPYFWGFHFGIAVGFS